MSRAARRVWLPVAIFLVCFALAFWLGPRARPELRVEPVLEQAVEAAAPAPTPPHAHAPTPPRPQARVAAPSGEVDTVTAGLHPRDPNEWAGMLVNIEAQALCEGERSCGLAMACLGGKCGPCLYDRDCASGESCVLDHCVRSERVSCRSRHDCDADELCVLTGYSSEGPRNNESMDAVCAALEGGREQRPEELARENPAVSEQTPDDWGGAEPVLAQDLMEEARRLFAQPDAPHI